MKQKFVAYYRVSTARQETSGLGLQDQKNKVAEYVKQQGGMLIDEFTEIETGTRKKKRVQIYQAIDRTKENNATLIVAKLDRLAREVEFTSALYRGGVDFKCVDNPNATKLSIQILSVMAEDEAERISERVKAALKVKKDRIKNGNYVNANGTMMKPILIKGKKIYRLGNPKGFADYGGNGVKAIIKHSRENKNNIQAMNVICSARTHEKLSFQKIADKLKSLGYKTRYGKEFTPMQVRRLYLRCSA